MSSDPRSPSIHPYQAPSTPIVMVLHQISLVSAGLQCGWACAGRAALAARRGERRNADAMRRSRVVALFPIPGRHRSCCRRRSALSRRELSQRAGPDAMELVPSSTSRALGFNGVCRALGSPPCTSWNLLLLSSLFTLPFPHMLWLAVAPSIAATPSSRSESRDHRVTTEPVARVPSAGGAGGVFHGAPVGYIERTAGRLVLVQASEGRKTNNRRAEFSSRAARRRAGADRRRTARCPPARVPGPRDVPRDGGAGG